MKKIYHRFTKEEDKVIFSNVQKYPTNLQQSFRISAKKLGLTPNQCYRRYYYKRSKGDMDYLFCTVSKHIVAPNTKQNTLSDKYNPKEYHKSMWKTICSYIKGIINK